LGQVIAWKIDALQAIYEGKNSGFLDSTKTENICPVEDRMQKIEAKLSQTPIPMLD